jgi:hypothetical protein
MTHSVWNKLRDGRWVSDYFVSNRSDTTWSAPVPRCPLICGGLWSSQKRRPTCLNVSRLSG